MKRVLLWAIVCAALVIAILVYRQRQAMDRLNVDPNAGKAIEKARGQKP